MRVSDYYTCRGMDAPGNFRHRTIRRVRARTTWCRRITWRRNTCDEVSARRRAAGGGSLKGPLFRSCAVGSAGLVRFRISIDSGRRFANRMYQASGREAWQNPDAVSAEVCAHSFRGSLGYTDPSARTGGDPGQVAARIAGHESTRTTQLATTGVHFGRDCVRIRIEESSGYIFDQRCSCLRIVHRSIESCKASWCRYMEVRGIKAKR